MPPLESGSASEDAALFSGDDDLDLVLYYIRCLSNVFRWAPDTVWAVLAKRSIRPTAYFPPLSEISKNPSAVSLSPDANYPKLEPMMMCPSKNFFSMYASVAWPAAKSWRALKSVSRNFTVHL